MVGRHDNTMSPTKKTNGNGDRVCSFAGAFGGPNSTGSAAATMHQVVLHGPFGGPHSTGNGSHQEEHPLDDQQLEHSGHDVQEKEMIIEDEDAIEKMPTTGSHTTTEDSKKGTGSEQALVKEVMSDTKVDTGNEQGPKEMMAAPEKVQKEIMPTPVLQIITTEASRGSRHSGDEEEKINMDRASDKPDQAVAPAINV